MRRAEDDLVARLREGDEAALDEFLDAYFDAIYNFIFYRVDKNHHDAEDITQETLLAAVRAIGTYAGESGLYAWVVGIARRRLSRHYRRRDARRRLSTALSALDARMNEMVRDIETNEIPEDLCQEREVREMVGATLSALPPRYSRLLRMKYADDLSVQEISRREDATPKAIESALTRARELFRRSFALVVDDLSPQVES